MAVQFTKITPGLSLTDEDLVAIGAVVAQWAIAEKVIAQHVFRLTYLTPNPKNRNVALRQEFHRMREQWKTLVREVCGAATDYVEIGVALAGAAKVLKDDRDAAAHWPASRNGDASEAPPQFVRMTTKNLGTPFVRKNFTVEDLLALSRRIYQLAADVTFFDHAMFADLFPSLCTWHGPKPAGPILYSRQIPTIQQPPRPQPSSPG